MITSHGGAKYFLSLMIFLRRQFFYTMKTKFCVLDEFKVFKENQGDQM
jgi:hypothetical protein